MGVCRWEGAGEGEFVSPRSQLRLTFVGTLTSATTRAEGLTINVLLRRLVWAIRFELEECPIRGALDGTA
jgi:hypothetical protein